MPENDFHLEECKNSKADLDLIQFAHDTIKQKYRENFCTHISALRTKSGKIYHATNLKYRYGQATMCSERIVIFQAENAGCSDFDTIVGGKYDPESETFKIVPPCAFCRQIEIYYPGLKTILMDENGDLIVKTIEELYPYPYK